MSTSFTQSVRAKAGDEIVLEVNCRAHGAGVVYACRLLARVSLQNTRFNQHGFDIIGKG